MMTTTKPNLQIDDLVREMTEEEFKLFKDQQKASGAVEAQAKAKAAARESALAKLSELGLTEEEIAAL